MDPAIIFFGLGVGILIGLTGVGGGSLMTPLLLLAGGYSPVVAIGTDLAYGAVTKTVSGWRHLRAGHVDLRLSWWLAAGSIPGSILGVITLNRLHAAHGEDFDPYLLGAVAAALILAACATLYRALLMPEQARRERASAGLQRRVSKAGTVVIGLVLGFILGLASVGSGALVGLVLILLYRLKPRRVVGDRPVRRGARRPVEGGRADVTGGAARGAGRDRAAVGRPAPAPAQPERSSSASMSR